MSSLTAEQKKAKLAANKAKVIARKKQLLEGRDALKNKKMRKMVHRKEYIEYDFTTAQDTRGGFLKESVSNRDDQTLDEWKKKQQERVVVDAPPPEDLALAPRCFDCNTIDINQEYFKVYGTRVCNKCKDKFPEKYSLLTKTESKQDYFLTEPELMDDRLFHRIEKANPHAAFLRMQLFMRYQIEEFAFKKWGGAEGLDKEWLRREKFKIDKKNKKFEQRLLEMKKRTRAEEYTRKLREKKSGYAHEHDWRQIEGDKKRCVDCGFEVEEVTF